VDQRDIAWQGPPYLFLERKHRELTGASAIPTAEDIQTTTEIWYEKGFREGTEHVKASCDAKLEVKEQECKAWIESARTVWAEAEGARLAQAARRCGGKHQTDISNAVARILGPLAAQKLVDEALAQLAHEIDKLLSSEDAIHLKIQSCRSCVRVTQEHPFECDRNGDGWGKA